MTTPGWRSTGGWLDREQLRHQFERQFAPELAAVDEEAVVAAGDVLTQLDSIDLLRGHRHLSAAETAEALRVGLTSLLGSGSMT